MKTASEKSLMTIIHAVTRYSNLQSGTTSKMFFFFFISCIILIGACKKKDTPPSIPTVTTAAIKDVTPSSAKGGGEIISDGGSLLLASGLCYSTTSQVPTITDDTTRTAALIGNFISNLKNLNSNSKYYVRAYATNSIGTAYGEVQTFTTGNEAPVASNVTITGEIKVDVELMATYTFIDKEGDTENGTTTQWYRADDASGANTVVIEDAIVNKYRITDADLGKIIWVGITPRANTGTQIGEEYTSEKKGPVGEATTVTFVYDNQEVTYGIWNSTKTGRRWMDRNLGAPNAPSAYNDYANYGDLFQWGRLADGHQLIIRTASVSDPFSGTSVPKNSEISNIKATTPTAPNNKFISPAALPIDWIDPQNNDLWKGVSGVNNPCPTGWRVPTSDEWTAEQLTADPVANYNQLKITRTGYRLEEADLASVARGGYYWTSSIPAVGTGAVSVSQVSTDEPEIFGRSRARALACRCIKD